MIERRIFCLISAAAALSGCVAAPVQAAGGQLVDVQIVDRARSTVLAEYRHRGSNYVAGRAGERFAVRMINRSGARVLVVLSVDGVNAISGDTATTAQTGYVLGPWQSADITGWRKSDVEAAAFYFTALPDSYAARTERPHHVGVIGAAVFRERAPLPRPRPRPFEAAPYLRGRGNTSKAEAADAPSATPAPERDAARAQGGSALAQRSDKLGTGHGEREFSPIGHTAFERATSQPAEIVQVRYDSHANLVASGVISPRHAGPDPFPGYVPDPRW
jgi:hypothetical protein